MAVTHPEWPYLVGIGLAEPSSSKLPGHLSQRISERFSLFLTSEPL
jgi:hypothetical protein